MKKYIAEFVGTFILVFIGCGAASIGGKALGPLGIGLAFGLALIAAAYSIGPISGGLINPAATLGMFIARRINGRDTVAYIVSQCLGAIVAAGLLAIIVKGKLSGYDIAASGLGQNGWGAGYGNGYSLISAIIFEFIASFLFIMVILESTQEGAPQQFAGLAIGIALAALVMFGLPITGTSVNPARSLGPALIMRGHALAQVWLFLIVPSFSGILAGLFYRYENVSLISKVIPQK